MTSFFSFYGGGGGVGGTHFEEMRCSLKQTNKQDIFV